MKMMLLYNLLMLIFLLKRKPLYLRTMNKLVKIFFLLLVICIRFSENNYAQRVAVKSADTGNYISLISYDPYENTWMGRNKPDTLFLGLDKAVCKAIYENMLFYTQKPGYRSKTQLVKRSDIIKSKTTYALEPLKPLPEKSDSEQYIYVERVSFNVDAKNYVKKNYETYEDYVLGKSEGTAVGREDFKFENTIFFDSLNKFLTVNGYIDTNDRIAFGSSDMVKIDLDINKITEHLFGSFMVLDLDVKVKVLDAFGKSSTYEKNYKTLSNISFSVANAETNKRLFYNALENLLCDVMEDKEMKEKFVNIEKRMAEATAKWNVIDIANKVTQEINIENAASSVVTIKLKKGHGSGCIVSGNGYIITNYHVVEDADTNNIEAIFNEGNKIKCKVIRSNPYYDLALLKMDTAVTSFMKINVGKAIKLGADVYAIGTPSDVALGQSITKGIISGKRIIENKTFIQSDVSVNKGNSGGAMTNKEGELIGIVSAKLIGVGIEGVGFAIPAYYLEEALKIKIQQ